MEYWVNNNDMELLGETCQTLMELTNYDSKKKKLYFKSFDNTDVDQIIINLAKRVDKPYKIFDNNFRKYMLNLKHDRWDFAPFSNIKKIVIKGDLILEDKTPTYTVTNSNGITITDFIKSVYGVIRNKHIAITPIIMENQPDGETLNLKIGLI